MVFRYVFCTNRQPCLTVHVPAAVQAPSLLLQGVPAGFVLQTPAVESSQYLHSSPQLGQFCAGHAYAPCGNRSIDRSYCLAIVQLAPLTVAVKDWM